ncbi:xanthine dehydrogenase family protein subunit M [candidate division KSB1 bacterium]|nr:xanthine dehydrogenase family protein subunit M [candidate division KSB1 bacterium]MBL7095877.1 xanthine dehydrogenase family protein subunit M [candidate division KSB1 bacterium]
MIPSIEYIRPENLYDLLTLLNKHNGDAKILAGGTDIITGLQQGLSRFKKIKILIDINNIPELKGIRKEKENIVIGAANTFSDIINNSLIKKYFPLLTKAASGIGSAQIRNRATMTGNFVNNAPCADSVPALLVYDASIKLESLEQHKEILLKDFLRRPYQTRLQTDEVVTEIKLPILSENYLGDFYKLGRRRSLSISRITLAVLMDIQDSIIKDIRFASGAVTPIGKRFEELESYACGKKACDEFFKELSLQMGKQILEQTGLRWSSAYKLPVVQQMFYQFLQRVHCLS